jgi:hypothetical protein
MNIVTIQIGLDMLEEPLTCLSQFGSQVKAFNLRLLLVIFAVFYTNALQISSKNISFYSYHPLSRALITLKNN